MSRSRLVLSLCVAAPLAFGSTACSRGAEDGAQRSSATADVTRGRNGAPLDTMRIPAELRHLAPLARVWGIGDDVDRGTVMPDEAAAFMYTRLAIEEMPEE